jgi:heme exporter protein D
MNWGSLGTFLEMGGYGLYVWGSYGVTFALLVVEIILLVLRRRGLIAQLRRTDLPRRSS